MRSSSTFKPVWLLVRWLNSQSVPQAMRRLSRTDNGILHPPWRAMRLVRRSRRPSERSAALLSFNIPRPQDDRDHGIVFLAYSLSLDPHDSACNLDGPKRTAEHSLERLLQ